MQEHTRRKLNEAKEEVYAAAHALHENHDSWAACNRLIDAVLMITAILEELGTETEGK